MKDAQFCEEVLRGVARGGHGLASEVLAMELAGEMEIFRFPKAGCFLAWDGKLMQLAFSQFSKQVVDAIGTALHQKRHCNINANTRDERIAKMLCARFGFERLEHYGQDIYMVKRNVL